MKHYVVIGGSAAGLSAAEAIRRKAEKARITIVSDEPGRPYSRPLLSFVLDGSIPRERLYMGPQGYDADQGLEFLSGRRAESVDPKKGQVLLDDGKKLDYDALLVATGTRAKPIKVPGDDLKGVFYFRSKRDMEGADGSLKGASRAVVVGGGLVAIKVADALRKRGLAVTVLISSDFPLSRMADPVTGAMVANVLGAKGVAFKTGVSPVEIQGKKGRVVQVATDDGQVVPCQLIVIGKGVLANTGFLAGSGVQVGRGIQTDGHLQTNISGLFAAGDVAETFDVAWGDCRLHALWPAAVEQGRIAGCNMTGEGISYPGTIACNALRIADLTIISGGISNPPPEEGYQSHVCHEPLKRTYKKIVTKDGSMAGMVFVNDIASAGVVLSMIRKRMPLSSVKADCLSARFNAGQVSFII